jgi:hypothetical protein
VDNDLPKKVKISAGLCPEAGGADRPQELFSSFLFNQ